MAVMQKLMSAQSHVAIVDLYMFFKTVTYDNFFFWDAKCSFLLWPCHSTCHSWAAKAFQPRSWQSPPVMAQAASLALTPAPREEPPAPPAPESWTQRQLPPAPVHAPVHVRPPPKALAIGAKAQHRSTLSLSRTQTVSGSPESEGCGI